MGTEETLYVKDRRQWRAWLEKYHLSKKEIRLMIYKKHTGMPGIPYDDAVEEAVCFGWIDGKVKGLDKDKYLQRYAPRKPGSPWAESNIDRAKRMIAVGKMTEWGLALYEEAVKANNIIPSSKSFTVPGDLKMALSKNKTALSNFDRFSPSVQLQYVYWVDAAKTEETRKKRILSTVERAGQNKKFGER